MLLLDLFCGEGGAATGYAQAGFTVVGVDIESKHKKRYPFEFHADNALDFLARHGKEFDVIHASPPCQHASAGTRAVRSKHEKEYVALIPAVRQQLIHIGKPYVIENVLGAKLRNPIMLCGTEFGLTAIDDDGTPLEMWRHRLFESNVSLQRKSECRHHLFSQQVAGSYGGARRDKHEARYIRKGGYVPSKSIQEQLLGIHWMTQYGLYQSIPPVYTEWLGSQIKKALEI